MEIRLRSERREGNASVYIFCSIDGFSLRGYSFGLYGKSKIDYDLIKIWLIGYSVLKAIQLGYCPLIQASKVLNEMGEIEYWIEHGHWIFGWIGMQSRTLLSNDRRIGHWIVDNANELGINIVEENDPWRA